jgi:quercetin dioxygenase-like cupin family protein
MYAMVNRRLLLGGAGALFAQALRNQADAQGRPPLFQQEIPELNTKNWQVTVLEVRYQPGQKDRAHRHPGITIVYVLEGEVVTKINDGDQRTYRKGDVFMENPSDLHAVSGNASATNPAAILVVMLSEKGKPLTKPELA